jgi:cbb3-type cytochrome oxidase subunit 3
MKTAAAQLQSLQSQGQYMTQLQSNVDLVLARHRLQSSYLSRMAQWFSRQAWWLKLLLGLALTALFVGIGIIFHWGLAIGLGLFSLLFYGGLAYLFQNEQQCQKKQEQNLTEDTQTMEKELADACQHLMAVEKNLKEIFLAIWHLNTCMVKDLQGFEIELQSLRLKNESLHELIQGLEQSNARLSHEHDDLKQRFLDALSGLTRHEASFALEAKTLSDTTQGFDRVQEQLSLDHQQLVRVMENFHRSTEALESLTLSVHELVPKLQAREALSLSKKSDTNALIAHSDAVMKQAEATVARVLQQLDAYEHRNEPMADDDTDYASSPGASPSF